MVVIGEMSAVVCTGCGPRYVHLGLLHAADLPAAVLQAHPTLRRSKCKRQSCYLFSARRFVTVCKSARLVKAKVHYAIGGRKLVRDLLETCSLASLGLCVPHGACVVVSLSPKSTMLASPRLVRVHDPH